MDNVRSGNRFWLRPLRGLGCVPETVCVRFRLLQRCDLMTRETGSGSNEDSCLGLFSSCLPSPGASPIRVRFLLLIMPRDQKISTANQKASQSNFETVCLQKLIRARVYSG